MHDTNTSRLGQTIAVVVAALTVLSMGAGVATAAGDTNISVSAATGTLEPGETTTVEVVLEDADGGVGSGQLQASLTDPSVAEITDIEVGGDPGAESDPIFAADGSSVQASYAFDDTDDTGEVTVAVVTVEATSAGSTAVELSGPPDIADGLLTFGDEGGESYAIQSVGSASITVEEPNTPPTIDSLADQTVTEGESATVGVTASDADGDSVSLSLTASPDFVTLSDGQLTIAPGDGDAADAPYTVTVEADDGSATTTESFDVTVDEPAAATFQVSGLSAPSSVTAGETIDVTADVENAGGQSDEQTIEFRLDADGDGTLAPDEALASQSVDLDAGASTTVTFEDVDTTGLEGEFAHGVFSANDSATGTITVANASDSDPAPGNGSGTGPGTGTTVELTPASEATGVGATATYEVVVTNASGGVGAAELGVTVADAGTATIADATVFGEGSDDVQVAADGESVDVEYAFRDTADTGSVAVASVTVTGESAGNTSLSIGPSAGNDEVQVFDEDGDGYDVTGTAGATLEVEPVSFEVSNLDAPAATARGETVTVSADVTNTGAVESTQTVSYVLDVNQDGTPETLASQTVTIVAGETASVSFDVEIPADASFGDREHGIVAPGTGETTTIAVTPAATAGGDLPTDPDGDGLFEDVNGDGTVDSGDAQALFDGRDDAAVQDATVAFDFNGDGEVDAGDAQALFGLVTA